MTRLMQKRSFKSFRTALRSENEQIPTMYATTVNKAIVGKVVFGGYTEKCACGKIRICDNDYH